MSKRTPAAISDFGTPELAQRRRIVPQLTGRGYAVRMKVVDETCFDRLLLRRQITFEQHEAGSRLIDDLHRAQMTGPGCHGFEFRSPGGDPQPVSEMQSRYREKVGRMIERINERVGRPASALLLNVALHDEFIVTGTDLQWLSDALSALAQFYDDWRNGSG